MSDSHCSQELFTTDMLTPREIHYMSRNIMVLYLRAWSIPWYILLLGRIKKARPEDMFISLMYHPEDRKEDLSKLTDQICGMNGEYAYIKDSSMFWLYKPYQKKLCIPLALS